jgi:hypothetical protein
MLPIIEILERLGITWLVYDENTWESEKDIALNLPERRQVYGAAKLA